MAVMSVLDPVRTHSVHSVGHRRVLQSDQELVIQDTYARVASRRGSFQILRRLSKVKPLLGGWDGTTKADLEERCES